MNKKKDVAEWLEKYEIQVSHRKEEADKIIYVLKQCPWNEEHTDKSAYVIQYNNGNIVAGCHHNSCSENNWSTLRSKYEPTNKVTNENIDKYDGKNEDKKGQIDILIDIVEDIETYRTSMDETYVTIQNRENNVNVKYYRKGEKIMSTSKKITLTLICLLSIILGTGYFLGLAYFQTHFKIGTEINGFNCSFKSIDDADALLSREVQSYAMAVNTRNGGVEKISADDVGMKFAGKDELIDMVNHQNYNLWFLPENTNVTLPVGCYQIDETKMDEEFNSLKCMNDMVKPESAHIVETNDFYQVASAVKGNELDVNKARQIIETAIRQWQPEVDLEASECYIEAEDIDENVLQQRCDLLNSIQDTIITYDFGDRKETIDFEKIKDKFINKDYELSSKKIQKYIEKLAEKYDTVGVERKFVTFDDRTASVTGGDYGWKISVNDTALELMNLITEDTLDVVKPVYVQTAASRMKNDIAHSYLEIDASNDIAVMYVDGKPVVQSKIKVNGDIATGCYKVQSKQDITDDGRIRNISFGNSSIYQYTGNESSGFSGSDDISGFSSNGVKENCAAVDETSMTAIFNTMQDTWPVIVYNNENIGG